MMLRPMAQRTGPGSSAAVADGHPDGPPPALIWAALAAVYVIWGSTYLAIRVAIETMPPLLMASVRFLVAGGLLFAWSVGRGDRAGDPLGRRQWGAAAIVGGLLLAGGNGLVTLGEETIPSGVTSLFIATVPLWLVLIARVVLKERVGPREVGGILLGFAGLVLLAGLPGGEELALEGVVMLAVAPLLWAAGSLYSRRAPLPKRPLVGTGMEMLAGGAILAVVGVVRGELADVEPARFSLASILALAYLVVFGSIVAFTAYIWLLRSARTSLVATYAYVNPVVAVLLGWIILDEPMTGAKVVAGLVIVTAVAIIVSAGSTSRFEPTGVRRRGLPVARWKLMAALGVAVGVVALAAGLGGWAAVAVATLGFAALGLAGWRWGVDTRDGADWDVRSAPFPPDRPSRGHGP
jgi:drug/metabolite transporter (DMT)-like permease